MAQKKETTKVRLEKGSFFLKGSNLPSRSDVGVEGGNGGQPVFLALTGALVAAPLPLFHITSSRSSKSHYNLLTLLKNLEHLCLYI